jgi:uncharacterized protein YbjQ (UPF0145 family)
MEFSTTDGVPGRTVVASHGVAIGSTVRAKNIAKDIGAGLKSIVGGRSSRIQTCWLTPVPRPSNAWAPMPQTGG